MDPQAAEAMHKLLTTAMRDLAENSEIVAKEIAEVCRIFHAPGPEDVATTRLSRSLAFSLRFFFACQAAAQEAREQAEADAIAATAKSKAEAEADSIRLTAA